MSINAVYLYLPQNKGYVMSNLQNSYNKFLVLLQSLESESNFLQQKRKPKLSDIELIALALTAEHLSIDSENNLFQRLPKPLQGRIERSVYNRRKRALSFKIKALQQNAAMQIAQTESYHIVDSMPVEVCKFVRAKRSKVCQHEEQTAPDYGFCAAQNSHYFGYKLHATCTLNGVIKAFDLSQASTHDIYYLNDIKTQFSNCILIGDKGYLGQAIQQELFETHRIKLEVPKRTNQRDYKPYSPLLRKARKRIETIYSQLCDQFMIRRNYAKTFAGLAARVLTKITAFTMVQFYNFQNGLKLNHIKKAI